MPASDMARPSSMRRYLFRIFATISSPPEDALRLKRMLRPIPVSYTHLIVDLAFIQPLSRLLTSGAFGVAYKSHVCTLLVSFVAYIIANPSPKHKRSRPKLRATAFNFSIEFRSRTYESLHDSILRFAFQHDNIFYIGVSIFKKKKPAE